MARPLPPGIDESSSGGLPKLSLDEEGTLPFPRGDHAAGKDIDLDVGVIYTHEREFMVPLLSTLAASAPSLRMRLLLVDNHSEGGVQSWRHLVPETLVLHNPQRLHYAANLNRILAASTARYALLLNTDMYFDPARQCPARMVEFMDRHPECGISGCRLLHADGGDALAARRFQTLSIILARRLGLAGLMPGAVERYLYREHEPHETFECDWLSGCFLMLRREAYQQVGLFDESFGKYFEDVDICLRMARCGWRVLFHGGTSCYHLEQRASRRLLSIDAWRHFRAYLYWLRKWGYASPRAHAPAA